MPVTSAGELPTGEACRDEIVGGCPQHGDAATVAKSNISFTDIRRIRRTSRASHYAPKWEQNKGLGYPLDSGRPCGTDDRFLSSVNAGALPVPDRPQKAMVCPTPDCGRPPESTG